jgi:hypothetical protein
MAEAEPLLRFLGTHPTLLPAAPETYTSADIHHRVHDEVHPCLRCGQQAQVATIVEAKTDGPRWLDLCAACHQRWLLSDLPAEEGPLFPEGEGR